MDYEIKQISDEAVWEDFVLRQKPHTFLHSWVWGEHYRGLDSPVFRLGAYHQGRLVAVAQLLKISAKRGTYLLCPHGPIFDSQHSTEKIFSALTPAIVELARKQHCDFVRICPILEDTSAHREIFRSKGFRDAPIHMHPELSWILDVSVPETELLSNMRKTTRYLIKKAEKAGVEITESSEAKDLEKFWPIYQATVQRQNFTPFSPSYLAHEFELFSKDNGASFFFGKYSGEIVAAAIIIFYGDSAFYHHSGSIPKFADVNASYLLQWEVIKAAKKRGLRLYNFWGISPTDKPHHPWAGLSLFKKGFGGFAESYLHAQDYPLTLRYYFNYLVETVRRIRRGV